MGLSEILLSDAFLLSHRLDPEVTVDFTKGKNLDFFFLMRTNWACPYVCHRVLRGLAAARQGKKSTQIVKCLLIQDVNVSCPL